MAAADTAAGLAAFAGRGAGTDAERRAARWLAGQARTRRRDVHLESFWCRPNWPLAHAWHCLAALAGSLLLVSHPIPGGAVVLGVLLSVLADALAGRSIGRRLTLERASQNVVSPAPPAPAPASAGRRVRLIVTANYDAGRTGLAYRDALRGPGAALRRMAGNGRMTPGWLGWLAIELVWLLVIAALRATGAHGTGIGALQLIPTVLLVIELAVLIDLAGGGFGPAAGDNASGVAVALALVRALDAAPPRNLAVELVLQGAGDGTMTGLRRHLGRHRRELPARDVIVLGIGPCGAGRPAWWVSDGPLVPLSYLARLRALAAHQAAPAAQAGAPAGTRPIPHRGRGTAPGFPARARGLPALSLGCVDDRGLAPRSHQPADVAAALDPAAMDRLLEFALTLVDDIDAELSRTTGRRDAAPAAA